MARRSNTGELLRLLRATEAGALLSGEQARRVLGISRTAVWKQIASLRSLGYQIEAIPSQGYRLAGEPDLLDQEALCQTLAGTTVVGRTIRCLNETVSTNTDAFRSAEDGAVEGTVVLADRQTGGKGRLGRRWESPAGVNLYCSIVLKPDLAPSEAPQLTFLSAVATARAITAVTGLQPAIKWPNDLLLNDRKVAGLLNEMSAETDRISFVILGIGVNLNMQADQFPGDLRSPATSLLLESGRPVSRLRFASILLQELDREYVRFVREGFDPVRDEWSRLCNAAGRTVRVDMGNGVLQGKFGGLDRDGALLVRLPDGALERVLSGDVILV